MPSASFQPLLDVALADYVKQIGIDPVKHPFVDQLRSCHSPDDVLKLLEGKANEFKDFRDGNRKLIDCLNPVVKVIHTFSGILGEAASFVPFPPAGMIFTGLDILLAAASNVSSSYDALVDLFECIGNFLKRLRIYTDLPLSPSMTDIIVKIMIELLSVLALATKQTKQGRFKKFAKKLLGESEIEAVLQRLDRLTQEEGRMTMAQTLEVVHGLMSNVKVVMNDGKVSMDGIWRALDTMHQMANDINKIRRDQLQKDSRNWLSPPDPSPNYNTACEIHQDGTATWFFQGNVFTEWNAKGSLLWIYGKPGSGKSILMSSIIREVNRMRKAGLASMAYFYFDFRDTQKQDRRGLLSSLLSQFSAESDPCYHILSQLYSDHAGGTRQPSDDALFQCLIEMLQVQGEPAMYLIIDALDECPNISGMPTAREKVLECLEDLVSLQLPNLHICLSSRPEFDIRSSLEPLLQFRVSLDEETGQRADISGYIKSVVHSDRRMRKWSAEDKQLVISTLSDKADGMFRWVYCQLEILRRCFPSSIRGTLECMPKTLDATYEHMLLGIGEEKWKFAHQLFRCLAVAVTPLRVEDLAEIMALRFDGGGHPQYNAGWQLDNAEESVLSACSSLITVTNVMGSRIVQFAHFSVKEFLTSDRLATASENFSRYHIVADLAHTTLAQASLCVLLQLDDHIDKEGVRNFPLSDYAARHWFDHCQFGSMSSNIQDALKLLFDREKPYFSAWIWIFDIDDPWRESMDTKHPERPEASPLYYAILCGFPWLIEYLIVTYPGDMDARGGYYGTPLHALIRKEDITSSRGAGMHVLENGDKRPLHRTSSCERVDIVQLLLKHNVDVHLPNNIGRTPLHHASASGKLEIARLLVQWGADVQARDKINWTPLHVASTCGHLGVAQFLIDSGADVNPQNDEGRTPLHSASRLGHIDIVDLLIQRGADVNKQDENQETSLKGASASCKLEIARRLVQAGADVQARDKDNGSPLQTASRHGHLVVVQFLIDSGADVNVHNSRGSTPLHSASEMGYTDVVEFLIRNGADVNKRAENHTTPLYLASASGNLDISRLLVQQGADVQSWTSFGWTPLHAASYPGHLGVVQFLIDSGADVNTQNNKETPLQLASQQGHLDIVELLIQHGADIDLPSKEGKTPLYHASMGGSLDVSRLLVQKGADVHSQRDDGWTPLHTASVHGRLDVVRFLIDSGADVNARDNRSWTPLYLAACNGYLDVVKVLLEDGADFSIRDDSDMTPMDVAFDNEQHEVSDFLSILMTGSVPPDRVVDTISPTVSPQSSPSGAFHSPGKIEDGISSDNGQLSLSLYTASENGQVDIVWSLLDRGSDVNEKNPLRATPLAAASMHGHLEVATLLIGRGADVNSRDRLGNTPLLVAVEHVQLEAVRLLLDNGADVNAQMRNHDTALHLSSCSMKIDMAQLLLERGANLNALDAGGKTPRQVAQQRGNRRVAEFLLGLEDHGNVTI